MNFSTSGGTISFSSTQFVSLARTFKWKPPPGLEKHNGPFCNVIWWGSHFVGDPGPLLWRETETVFEKLSAGKGRLSRGASTTIDGNCKISWTHTNQECEKLQSHTAHTVLYWPCVIDAAVPAQHGCSTCNEFRTQRQHRKCFGLSQLKSVSLLYNRQFNKCIYVNCVSVSFKTYSRTSSGVVDTVDIF